MRDYFQSPVDKSWVNFDGHPQGDAMDLGWRTSVGRNQPVYMPADGTVIENAYYDDGGNSLITKHDYNDQYDAWVGMMHFKDKAKGSAGEFIKRGTQIAIMGNTGKSFGEHVHIRLSLAPKGTSFSWGKFNEYRVNPYDYFFEFSHQDVLDLKKKPSKPFKPSKSNEIKEDGEITVTVDVGLRVRQSPSLSARQTDLLPKGTKKVYTHYVDADGIRWVKLKEGGYVARRKLDNSEVYADARFLNEPAPSKPKPKPQPSKPAFKPYNYSLPKGSTLYNASGGAYAYPTTQVHTVKILKENNGLGLIREPWLQGVSEAWVKLGAKPKPVFKPYNKTLPANSKLYDSNGNAYAYPTTNTHTVKVLQEKNGLGLIRESWLVGVSEAWIKL